ncbi:hypothetical protein JOD54_006774 [Actinokineospora baliensis]|uniref:hypothetical protein n=1 Tax=Actinokineospora baliensis TaxID=547056 RepID=UPI001958188E|nr:hypothetical protein [Actinokineospora baliensis]MBM7776570.1 hypothetical protein [Actinokineospora baliensis]
MVAGALIIGGFAAAFACRAGSDRSFARGQTGLYRLDGFGQVRAGAVVGVAAVSPLAVSAERRTGTSEVVATGYELLIISGPAAACRAGVVEVRVAGSVLVVPAERPRAEDRSFAGGRVSAPFGLAVSAERLTAEDGSFAGTRVGLYWPDGVGLGKAGAVAGFEALIIGRLAAAVACHGRVVLARRFAAVARDRGLVNGLWWLIAALRGVAGVVGLVAVLRGLVEAVESGEPRPVVLRTIAVIEASAAR